MATVIQLKIMKTIKTATLDLDQFSDLVKGSQDGFQGWVNPVWAKINEENEIELSLGCQVNKGTSFIDYDGNYSLNHVGDIDVWFTHYNKDDADIWAEDNDCEAQCFDWDIELDCEVDVITDKLIDEEEVAYIYLSKKNPQGIDLSITDFCGGELENSFIFQCAMYAKDKGFDYLLLR